MRFTRSAFAAGRTRCLAAHTKDHIIERQAHAVNKEDRIVASVTKLKPAGTQLMTVRRPWVRMPPRNDRANRGADRLQRVVSRKGNHWHGATSGCEDLLVDAAWGGYERMVRNGRFTCVAPF